MKIAISGASGYIGKHLTLFFIKLRYKVIPIPRELFGEEAFPELVNRISGCNVVINLAGARLNKRWTQAHKAELYNSRIPVTRQLVRAIEAAPEKPQLFISASAVGYYPVTGCYDEYNAVQGTGFLAGLCHKWEKEARQCPKEVRLVITRLGIVLSDDGGAMKQMIFYQKLTHFSTIIGKGSQAFPWIGVKDLCHVMNFIIQHTELQEVVNLTAPQYITQKELAHALKRAYYAWGTLPVSPFFFRILYGEGASFLTEGQTIYPGKLLETGYSYLTPTLEKLLNITDHHTVGELDIPRYMGKWYEIARYENRFEKGMKNVTTIYTLLPDGTIRVENCGYKNNVFKKIVGKAKQPDKSQPGKLKVSFFPPFYSDYYILELDKLNYSYAIVGSSSDKYLWILSREKPLSEETKEKLLRIVCQKGYDIHKLLFT